MKQERKTIEFFKEISKIPRESGNEKSISEYLCKFAQERNLEYIKDKYNNVCIKKKTIEKEPIILQAHMDMVCEKEENRKFDFGKDAIQVIEQNGYLMADGTTLGADNGIGVAQILNILDSNIPCNIEAIFTTSEETSMDGAIHFDTTKLKSKYMINLDGFEENTIIIESACFYDIIMKDNLQLGEIENQKKYYYEIQLNGLEGGHSGFDINKNRGNASILLAELLSNITKIQEISITEFNSGTKFNVIPSQGTCNFMSEIELDKIKGIIDKVINKYHNEYKNIQIEVKQKNKEGNIKGLNEKQTEKLIQTILNFKHGVYFTNENNEPTTSVNLGVVSLQEHVMKVGMRSSRESEENICLQDLETYAKKNALEFIILGSQPGFEVSKQSKLVTKLLESRPEEYIKQGTKLQSVHITVEAGLFKEKMPDVEIAIISPYISGAHTTKEKVKIDSIQLTDEWLENILKEKF